MRDKSHGRECDPQPFVPRKATTFSIGPNSHPRKAQRYLDRGGVEIKEHILAKAAARNVHPRHLRKRP